MKKGLDNKKLLSYNISVIARLCKGSTSDSDSLCEGSNPSLAAILSVNMINKKHPFGCFLLYSSL